MGVGEGILACPTKNDLPGGIMIHVPFALRLHTFGLQRLHDPNWTGGDLYDHLKRYMRRHGEPNGVLFKTLDRGVLWLLGGWLFDDLLSPQRLRDDVAERNLGGEYLMWHLEEVAAFIVTISGHDVRGVDQVEKVITRLAGLYGSDEAAYLERLDGEDTQDELLARYEEMFEANASVLKQARDSYAVNYADRVFHDRELCSYISQLILAIGIDGGLGEGEEPSQWVERCEWPEWAKGALRARERGACALCGNNLVLELEGDAQIDHIVPISRGGTNDLVNLQMLCARCNRTKTDADVPVRSSIPPYLSRRLPTRGDQK